MDIYHYFTTMVPLPKWYHKIVWSDDDIILHEYIMFVYLYSIHYYLIIYSLRNIFVSFWRPTYYF